MTVNHICFQKHPFGSFFLRTVFGWHLSFAGLLASSQEVVICGSSAVEMCYFMGQLAGECLACLKAQIFLCLCRSVQKLLWLTSAT